MYDTMSWHDDTDIMTWHDDIDRGREGEGGRGGEAYSYIVSTNDDG